MLPSKEFLSAVATVKSELEKFHGPPITDAEAAVWLYARECGVFFGGATPVEHEKIMKKLMKRFGLDWRLLYRSSLQERVARMDLCPEIIAAVVKETR